MPDSSYEVEFPAYLDGNEFETESKGYLVDLIVRSGAREWNLTVFDPVRLGQDVADDVRASGYLALSNVLIVAEVTRGGDCRCGEIGQVRFRRLELIGLCLTMETCAAVPSGRLVLCVTEGLYRAVEWILWL
jgi:hypothetical protein